jgi:hypothetical protein
MAFYVDCNQWPDPAVDPEIQQKMMGNGVLTTQDCQNPKYQNQTVKYMPAGSDQNPLWLPDGTYEISVDSKLFVVSTKITSSVANRAHSSVAINIAKMIAGRLPNATVQIEGSNIDSPVYVHAYVGSPAQATLENTHGFILDMEMVNSTAVASHIKVPDQNSCPPGMQAVLVGSMAGIDAGTGEYHGQGVIFAPNNSAFSNVILQNGFIANIGTQPGTGLIQPDLVTNRNLEGSGYLDTGKNQVLLITACLPSPNPNVSKQVANQSQIRY